MCCLFDASWLFGKVAAAAFSLIIAHRVRSASAILSGSGEATWVNPEPQHGDGVDLDALSSPLIMSN